MSTVGRISVLNLAGKASQKLRKTPILELSAHDYSRFLSETAVQDSDVAAKLVEMGLDGNITPKNIQQLNDYGAVFTPNGTLTPECVDDIDATVFSYGEAAKEMTALDYLTNPYTWKPALLDVLGLTRKDVKRANMLELNAPLADAMLPQEKFIRRFTQST